MPKHQPTALVVEDEEHIRELVCLHLGLEGFHCIPVGDGREALRVVDEQSLDLVILDVMIPGLDGITVCRAIRRRPVDGDVPILMLTARRQEADKVVGLESGADDYLTKPFGVRELVARVHALMRRPRAGPLVEGSAVGPSGDSGERRSAGDVVGAGRVVTVHGIKVDPARRRVMVGETEVELTSQEFRLLYVLASHAGIVFSREALLARVWKSDTFVTVRSVDTLIKRVRHKIDRVPGAANLIVTVRGAGYKFADV